MKIEFFFALAMLLVLSSALATRRLHAAQSFISEVMSGLMTPRGLAFQHNGGRCAAEVGSGAGVLLGNDSTALPCATSGQSRLLGGVRSRVLGDLPSVATAAGVGNLRRRWTACSDGRGELVGPSQMTLGTSFDNASRLWYACTELHYGAERQSMSDVTDILSAIDLGDPVATEKLLPLVYDELRKLAAAKLANERPGQTLQATALVHEAYLRLVGSDGQGVRWDHRGHFFAAAAEAMRRILIDSARRRKTDKRGNDPIRQELDNIEIAAAEVPEDLVALDEALVELSATDKTAADLVHLRYFAGLSIPDAAEALGMSPRRAARVWAFARAWLRQNMEGQSPDQCPPA